MLHWIIGRKNTRFRPLGCIHIKTVTPARWSSAHEDTVTSLDSGYRYDRGWKSFPHLGRITEPSDT